jgi:hypothetical protein
MAESIVIAGNMAKLAIEVSGYENPAASDPFDANWLSCNVVLRMGDFSGSMTAAFTTQDFARFLDEIRASLSSFSGTASFLTHEDMLRLSLQFEKTGLVLVSGVVQDFGPPKVAFTFSFESDQSFLSETCKHLERVVHRFPVKEP